MTLQLEKTKTTGWCVGGLHGFYSDQSEVVKQYWPAATAAQFRAHQLKLFSGEVINHSENRAAWHTAFRQQSPNPEVAAILTKIEQVSNSIRVDQGITDVVNIGIGGSDLGPRLVCEAFCNQVTGPSIHFVSNLDRVQIDQLLKNLSPANTLFIVTSKSFRTLETVENMQIAIAWMKAYQVNPAENLIAITQNVTTAMQQYHIPESQIFMIPEWIGGRFSIWSAVGLSCAIAFGFDQFYQLHCGARLMDAHFKEVDILENAPVSYATFLYDSILKKNNRTLAVLPYAQRLQLLPAYLQQLFMESLGKHVDTDGNLVDYLTGPIVYGGVGTNAQHSFQQLMMQGTHPIFADFVLPLEQDDTSSRSQALMAANCLAQVNVLRSGVENEDARKAIPGGQTANLFVLEKLNMSNLGALLAFYEHVVVTLAFLLKINPFDQWGVEFAKQKSKIYFDQFGKKLLSVEELAKNLI